MHAHLPRCPSLQPLPLYSAEVMQRYVLPEAQRDVSLALPPSIFDVGSRAYHCCVRDQVPQSVIISGESGAGKTEATKQVLKFVAELSASSASSSSGRGGAGAGKGAPAAAGTGAAPGVGTGAAPCRASLERQIMQANPVIEAFGNAKTARNSNSSRFGKLIRVFLDPRSGAITNGSITNYLLEKSRVVQCVEGERGYHVFYQVHVYTYR